MANIASLDDYLSKNRQKISYYRGTPTTVVANKPFTLFHLAGSPGAVSWYKSYTGSLVTSGISNDGIFIPAVTGATSCNLVGLKYYSTVVSTVTLNEIVGYCGTFYATPNTYSGITGGPVDTAISYNSTPYYDTQLWINIVSPVTGTLNVNITYTNQDGVAGRTTGVQGTGITALGALYRMRLQAGDYGIRSIQSVVSSVSTAGNFNVLIVRELTTIKVSTVNEVVCKNLVDLGLPIITPSSTALLPFYTFGTTSSGLSTLEIEIAG